MYMLNDLNHELFHKDYFDREIYKLFLLPCFCGIWQLFLKKKHCSLLIMNTCTADNIPFSKITVSQPLFEWWINICLEKFLPDVEN